ncbi:type II toxin-antitoxin system prevent-host-death family antitoxin [Cellulomonas biazotea]|uniref:Uncharacterized protein n=1 Tax=Cellulomonas biazotea TaxID=1709 RepID=A0A402DND7_9CELL|nr:type II toxin-antitoxin system prevent-host-death family antitoxin [Cellulomonas biazotea]GCE75643.1 hypothetical protein CBZ_06990 [Cellulomonas biazotea]
MSTPKSPRVDVRVVLPEGEHVVLAIPGDEPVVLEDDIVAALLAIGLDLRPVSRSRKQERPRLEVDDRVQFLVGGTDLGAKRGLRAVRDGLAIAVQVGLEEARAQAERRHAEAAPSGPTPVGVDAPELVMDVAGVEQSFDEVFARVERDEVRVVLTRDGRRVAVMVSWGRWRRLNERLARERLAYWTAWSDDGTFDALRFAEQVAPSTPDPDGGMAGSVGSGH